jgi:hypothetical protein
MKKTILEIYALAVCFFTVTCFAITLGIAIYDVIQVVYPSFTINNYKFEQHQSNEAFRNQLGSCGNKDKEPLLSEAEVTKKREESWALALRSERHEGAQSLVSMLIILFVSAIVFLIHWRIAQRSRESAHA